MYEYRVKILRIVDGDTVDVDIDLGFLRMANRFPLPLVMDTGDGNKITVAQTQQH